jgi:hypothetical protein
MAIASIALGGLCFHAFPGHGLATLAMFVGIEASWNLLSSALRHRGDGDAFWKRWLNDREARVGLDVLFTMSTATSLAILGLLLPT